MAKIYFFLKSYFGFSKRESKGFVLVVPALIVLYLIPSGYDWLVRKKNEEKKKKEKKEKRGHYEKACRKGCVEHTH